ncbi:MAG: threonine synthase [Chloroflexota bacterium]|nr:threonine synthase [Chloroflexota bacterium]
MRIRCTTCGRIYSLDTRRWRCDCGGPFELVGTPPFDEDAIEAQNPTLWRYRAMLPVEHEEDIVSLGEGFTPLVQAKVYGLMVHCKLEFLAPTGSFKDRGATVLVSKLKEMGIERVVEDSSGNAGAALAAYCAQAGIRAEIYVPAHASPAKLAQIAVYGAELVTVDGPRENAARAVQEAAASGIYYASHYYNPFVIAGLKTIAYELWEQLGGQAPHNLILPAGHGTLLLGAYRGFKDLQAAGLIEKPPRLFAIQAQTCAPLYKAYREGLSEAKPVAEGETIAEGIRIARPARGRQILAAIRETGGAVLAVSEEEIEQAQKELARRGLYVEPTSAVAAAALRRLSEVIAPHQITVVPLTGSGLKSK